MDKKKKSKPLCNSRRHLKVELIGKINMYCAISPFKFTEREGRQKPSSFLSIVNIMFCICYLTRTRKKKTSCKNNLPFSFPLLKSVPPYKIQQRLQVTVRQPQQTRTSALSLLIGAKTQALHFERISRIIALLQRLASSKSLETQIQLRERQLQTSGSDYWQPFLRREKLLSLLQNTRKDPDLKTL